MSPPISHPKVGDYSTLGGEHFVNYTAIYHFLYITQLIKLTNYKIGYEKKRVLSIEFLCDS